nr:carbohydrate binding family 9 domain-containing protein [Gemmatimonadota bacterium]
IHGQTNGELPDSADAAGFQPGVKPTLEIRRAPGPIAIDGELDDAGWRDAARATGFSENFPDEQARPPVGSEVWVTYDDEHLYLAFLAEDDPAAVRSSIKDRDQMWQDDYFGILLDTYGDAAWAYFLFANPAGVQGDSRFATAGGEDDGFDIVYQTEAKITERGYQIEMAIPFRSLRFPDRPRQTWRATFWRTHPRGSRATYTWASIDRDESCFLCQFGTLTGIEGVEPGGALELLPSVVASQAAELEDEEDPDSGLDNGGFDGEASLGLRYAHPSGVTAEASFNPDFSQVESDVGQIDANTTFALFFPERRPFFQEGSDLFGTFFSAVYTRQINDPEVAVKLIGRRGRSSLAYMGARDETSPILLPFEQRSFVGQAEKSVSNILRGRRTYGSNSYVGGLLTDRRFEDGGGTGTTYGVDGVHRFFDKYQLEYQVLGSRTAEPEDPGLTAALEDATFDEGKHTSAFDGETFSGFAQYTSIERDARFWNFDFDYWASSPTFRADNGFEFRNDVRRVSMFQGLTFWTENSRWTDFIAPGAFVQKRWTYGGDQRSDFYRAWVEAQLKKQTFVQVAYNWDQEVFREIDFRGIRNWEVFVQSNFSDPIRLGFSILGGEQIARNQVPPLLGEGIDLKLFGTIEPWDRLTIEPTLRYSELRDPSTNEEIFAGYIFRTRTTLNFSRRLFLRLVFQYDDFDSEFDVEPLLTYRINPFTLFFVGSTQAFEDFQEQAGFIQTSRQFFAKFQYLFQI